MIMQEIKRNYPKYIALFFLTLFVTWIVGDYFMPQSESDNNNKLPSDIIANDTPDTLSSYKKLASFDVKIQEPTCFTGYGKQFWIGGDSTILSYGFSNDLSKLKPISKIMLNINPGAMCFNADTLWIAAENKVFSYTNNKLDLAFTASDNTTLAAIQRIGNNLVVSDSENKTIGIYQTDGTLKLTLDNRADDGCGFDVPSGYFPVQKDGASNFWAANPGKHKLYKYNLEGTRLAAWGKDSMDISGFCGICNPNAFLVEPSGDIVTVEKGLTRIKRYTETGKLKDVILAPSVFKPSTQIKGIYAIDKKSFAFVEDMENKVWVIKQK